MEDCTAPPLAATEVLRPALPRHAGLQPLRPAHQHAPLQGLLLAGKERRRWLTDNGGPGLSNEFAVFDVYRVLRLGGVFRLDCLFCLGPQLDGTYVPILDRVSFRRLRWKTGRKLDRGAERNEWYVSALLEKPMT